jgi:hypothetical protein
MVTDRVRSFTGRSSAAPRPPIREHIEGFRLDCGFGVVPRSASYRALRRSREFSSHPLPAGRYQRSRATRRCVASTDAGRTTRLSYPEYQYVRGHHQAFSLAQDGSRTVYTIDRKKGLVRAIAIAAIAANLPEALTFRCGMPARGRSARTLEILRLW